MAVSELLASPPYLLLGLVLPLAVYWWYNHKQRGKLPPGPTPLPLLGNILEFRKHPMTYKYIADLSEQYGDVISFQIGPKTAIIINKIKAAREALIEKQDDYAGRPFMYSTSLTSRGGKDIAFGNYSPIWKLQRKLFYGAIRKFLTGTELERMISEGVDDITELFLKETDPFDPLDHLTLLIFNIIANATFGKRWKFDDPEFQELEARTKATVELFGNGLPPDYLPFLRYLPALPRERKCLKHVEWQINFLKRMYTKHRENYKHGEESDLVYHLMSIKEEAERTKEPNTSQLTDEHMFQIINDMFNAGTETTRFTLHWTLCYLIAYPEIQENIYQEIKNLCGNKPVRLENRKDLHYTDAVICEVLRIRTPTPMSMPHTTTCDTTLGEYQIPKDTWVFTNMWSLHHDPDQWENPHEFNPDRFLGNDGKMAAKPESYMPFSAGRRICAGEALAKSLLVLTVALFCQRLKFEDAPGEKVIPQNKESAIFCISVPYKMVCKLRD